MTAAGLCLIVAQRVTLDRTDLLLGIFLLLSIISGSFATVDRWEVIRPVGVTLSGAAVFWSSRDLASDNQRRLLLSRASLAVILVAVGVLLDAFTEGYGVSFAKPGGTQANRNWAGHLLALGLPLLAHQWPCPNDAKRVARRFLILFVSSAALVLTRSRAAWIAVFFGTGFTLAIFAATSRRFHSSTVLQVAASLSAMVLGILAAVYSPNRLMWRSPHPYLQTVQTLLAHNSGSGYGRLVQYQRSLAMAMDHPTLGVGSGNWKILYPAYSIGVRSRLVAAIWHVPSRPNSDWLAFTTERGVPVVAM